MKTVKMARGLLIIGCLLVATNGFAQGGTATLGLGDMSLEQLQDQEDKFRRDAEQARWEIDSLLQIFNLKEEKERRKEEKQEILSGSPQQQVEILKPEVSLLQRQLDALLDKERLISQKLRLIQQAQEAKLRIMELQRKPEFRLAGVVVGLMDDGKTGTDSTPSQFFVELGIRLPVVKEFTAVGPFVGISQSHIFGGVEAHIPVVSPEQGRPYGSWAEVGIAYNGKVSGLFGLRLGSDKWQFLFRYWSGIDTKLPLQFGVVCLF